MTLLPCAAFALSKLLDPSHILCGSDLLERIAAFNSQGCKDASLEGLGSLS